MKRAILRLGGALLAAAASAQTPTAQQIIARLTVNDLKADVSFLASDALEGRGTPSRGLDIAAEYIAAEFRRAGLEPAGDDGYFQTAPYVSVTPNLEGLELTLEAGGKVVKADVSGMAIGEAAAVQLDKAQVIKLSATDNDRFASLTAEQVRGKVLVVDFAAVAGGRGGGLPAGAVAHLQPALVITLTNPPRGRGNAATPRLRESPAVSLPSLTVWDEGVRKAIADAGDADIRLTVHIAAPVTTAVKLRNVAGLLRGSDPLLRETYVVVTGHYDHLGVRGTGEGDHIYNGANDDASGTASVIEIAHTLGSFANRPKRSLLFIALFGEEMGLLGSRYYAQHPLFPLAKTVADLNLEQVGRTDVDQGSRVGMVNVTGYDFTNVPAELKKAGAEFDVQVVKDEQNSDPYFGRSDNQAFADAGVPAHTLSVGYMFPEYHQAGDEWPKIDYENMARIDRAVALALWHMADNPTAPEWNASNPKTDRYVKAHQRLVGQ